jgi:hypothetical protein
MYIKNSIMHRFVVVLGVFALGISFAYAYPKGCVPVDYTYSVDDVVLNESGVQRVYFFNNHGHQPVELVRHEDSDAEMNPSLNAKLDPGGWSAFASNIAYLYFSCYVPKSAEDGNISRFKVRCQDVIDICAYPRAKFAVSNEGNYWITSNKPQMDILKEVAAKGIYLHW